MTTPRTTRRAPSRGLAHGLHDLFPRTGKHHSGFGIETTGSVHKSRDCAIHQAVIGSRLPHRNIVTMRCHIVDCWKRECSRLTPQRGKNRFYSQIRMPISIQGSWRKARPFRTSLRLLIQAKSCVDTAVHCTRPSQMNETGPGICTGVATTVLTATW